MREPPRPRRLRARPASSRTRASSSPSGSSRPTRPATGCPDMVAAAGGLDVAGMSGEPSHRMRWPDVAALEPDVVVLAPCGFDLDRTLSEVVPLDLSAHLLGTPARQESRVFAVDANAMFSRPGPRVVDGVEVLAHLLHPGEYPDPGCALEPGQALALVPASSAASPDGCGAPRRRARPGSAAPARRRRGRRRWPGRSASRGRRTRGRRRAPRRRRAGCPGAGSALSKAWSPPSTSRTTTSRSPASTTARPFASTGSSATSRRPAAASLTRPRLSRPVPLYLREADVEELAHPGRRRRGGRGLLRARWRAASSRTTPRRRLGLESGRLHVMAAADLELRRGRAEDLRRVRRGRALRRRALRRRRPELLALIEADRLGQLRTGAASAVAARHLAQAGDALRSG